MAIRHGVWLGLSSHSAIDHEIEPILLYNAIKLGHLQPKRNIVQTITYALQYHAFNNHPNPYHTWIEIRLKWMTINNTQLNRCTWTFINFLSSQEQIAEIIFCTLVTTNQDAVSYCSEYQSQHFINQSNLSIISLCWHRYILGKLFASLLHFAFNNSVSRKGHVVGNPHQNNE